MSYSVLLVAPPRKNMDPEPSRKCNKVNMCTVNKKLSAETKQKRGVVIRACDGRI
jgi:hypothetical protein